MFSRKHLPFLCLVVALLGGTRHVLAQADTTETPMSLLHGLYERLDPAQMPHGLLFQSAYPLTSLADLTGDSDPHDSLRVDVQRYGRVLFSLGSAVRDSAAPALFDLGFRDHYATRAHGQRIELSSVLAAGGLLRNAAFTNGWLATSADSSQLLPQSGMSAAAYRTDTVFAFSPTVSLPAGQEVTWGFTDSLFFRRRAV